MMRQATSLNNKFMAQDEFEKQAFFNVAEVDSAYMDMFGNWQKNPDKKSIINSETGEYISTVGKNYQIIQNKEYFETILDSLNRSGINYVPKQVHKMGTGKKTTLIVNLPDFDLFNNTSEIQTAELRISNSLDTTLSAETLLGWLRLICTNGMTAFEQDFKMRLLHKGDINAKTKDTIELYKDFDNTWQKNKQIIHRLGETNGDKQAVKEYIGDGEFTKSSLFKGERWAKKLLEKYQEEGEPNNLFDLYNINTNLISHSYGNQFSSKANMMALLNKEVRSWDKIFKTANVFNN